MSQRSVACDHFIDAVADAAGELDVLANRIRAIPAATIAGIAAKAATLQFDTSLYPEEPERPLRDWDWDVECLYLFVQEVKTPRGRQARKYSRRE